MTIATTDAQLQAARAAHGQAVQRHREATERWGRARDNHAAVALQRDAMLARAANGADVSVEDLARCTAALSASADVMALHAAVRDGARRTRDELEVAEARTAAAAHAARAGAAVQAALAAAGDVDEAVAVARARLEDFQARVGALGALDSEAACYNQHVLLVLLATNPVAAGLHPSSHPKMGMVHASLTGLTINLTHRPSGVAETARAVAVLTDLMRGALPATSPAAAPAASKAA
jgi:hypothetical protein